MTWPTVPRRSNWAAQLEGSTGAVGMYGFSYQAYNQLMSAAAAGPALKALAPAMFSWYPRTPLGIRQTAPSELGGNLGWAVQIAAETARHAGDEIAYAELRAAASQSACCTKPSRAGRR